ncbi:MAG TPA: hypothetical protein DDZ67_08810 [Xanthomonadaceae bacterium]|nr:hypothetical protein [Xanthomonadaceae bacterium]
MAYRMFSMSLLHDEVVAKLSALEVTAPVLRALYTDDTDFLRAFMNAASEITDHCDRSDLALARKRIDRIVAHQDLHLDGGCSGLAG